MVQDVAYWMNRGAEERGRTGDDRVCTIMASVEESTVADRAGGVLLGQDSFIRDHVTPLDTLVVSLGGNDVALRPTTWTIISMAMLTRSPDFLIRNRMAPGFSYFVSVFGGQVEEYVSRLIASGRPAKVVVCMLYYLDETAGGSWADGVLQKLGYDSNPAKLQLIIKTLFEAIREKGFTSLQHSSTEVVYFPLFKVLDGKDTEDYCHRVEPSVQGGRKMADALLDVIFAEDSSAAVDALLSQGE
jgi:hypothetical protein